MSEMSSVYVADAVSVEEVEAVLATLGLPRAVEASADADADFVGFSVAVDVVGPGNVEKLASDVAARLEAATGWHVRTIDELLAAGVPAAD